MNMKQLEAFLAIARHGGFVEAADRLNVTQSTISARIKELEQALADAIVSMEHDCYDLDEPHAVLVRARALLAGGR